MLRSGGLKKLTHLGLDTFEIVNQEDLSVLDHALLEHCPELEVLDLPDFEECLKQSVEEIWNNKLGRGKKVCFSWGAGSMRYVGKKFHSGGM